MYSSVGILLIAAGVGYWVLTLANKQKDRIKKLGQWLALIMITISLIGVGCKIYHVTQYGSGCKQRYCESKSVCPYAKGTPSRSQNSGS